MLKILQSSTTRKIYASRRFMPRSFATLMDEYESYSKEHQSDPYVVTSPYQSIAASMDEVPFTEFVVKNWIKPNGDIMKKVAMIDAITGQSRTFEDYFNDTASIASHFRNDFNIDNSSTIALFSPNHVDYVPLNLAAASCGAMMTPINPMFKADEVKRILERSNSKMLIVHIDNLDVGLEAVRGTNVTDILVIPREDDDPVPEGFVSISELKSHSDPSIKTHHSVHNNTSNHPFLLPYSSGTTGLPKGVMLSHANLKANLLQMEMMESMAFPSTHKLISPLPFFHIYGWLVSALYCVWQGQQVITMPRFDLEKFCEAVEKYRPERAHLVPPIVIQLAKNPIIDNYDLSSLNMIVSAAAPLSKAVEDSLMDRISCPVKQGWGMSELSPIAIYTNEYNIKSGSVGNLVPDTSGKIVDTETGKSLPPNNTGELMIKGPQVMMGYLNDEGKTAECLSEDGWLSTGDVAHYDDDGFFYITDRIKELIKVRGYQVAPAELEALLLTHPQLSDAAVVPVPDEYSDQLPRAYVTLKEGVNPEDCKEEDVKEWVKERVAAYKRLEGGVKFIEKVPKSASGKILRRILVDQVKAELEEKKE